MDNQQTKGMKITTVSIILGVIALVAAGLSLASLSAVKAGVDAMGRLTFAVITLIVVMVIVFAALTVLVIVPVSMNLKNMNSNKPLSVVGAEEIQRFASLYNENFATNEMNKKAIKEKEERDSLTGVYNNEAYERYLKDTIESDDEFALVMVDVDNYMTLLKTEGKEKAEKAVQRVANLLRQYFKGDRDYVCRVGTEDKFAVILTDIRSANANSVGKRIDKINEKLQNPTAEYLVPCSVSVGLAFSDGSTEREKINITADEAMKLAKDRGRCGYVVLDVEEKEKLKEALHNLL